MESHNVEYKESWRDEYIKWICGFANANGGKIYIGYTDDGEPKGIADAKRLLEEIPNKTKDLLGILVEVNLKKKKNLSCLEIIVEAYPYPISYKGQYHFRSGATKQELKGAALDKFILQKQGKRWDSVPQPGFSFKDIDKSALLSFKNKAADTKRVSLDVLKEKNEIVLDRLHLKADNRYYKRATVLLFYKDPEKYITGSYIKIGFFNTDDDLAFQDEVHGDLFSQVEKTMELLSTKYLKANISYVGVNRIEQYPIPETALREAVLNAIVHKDYSSFNPIQISVYANKLMIWNEGQLPEDWTVERLVTKHPSHPFNPDIANCFFRAGLIEAWGRGTIKILSECKQANIPKPVFKYDLSGFVLEFNYKPIQSALVSLPIVKTTSDKVVELIRLNENVTILELANSLGVVERTIKRIIKQLQEQNRIKRMGSDKIGSWIVLD